MILNRHQNIAHNKILASKISYIAWPRNAGKTYLALSIIEYYLKYKKDVDIFFISNNISHTAFNKDEVFKYFFNYMKKHSKDKFYFFNDNVINFYEINNENKIEHDLVYYKPELLIFDSLINPIYPIYYFLLKQECKTLFTVDNIDINFFYKIDYKETYLNIILEDNKMSNIILNKFSDKERFDFDDKVYIRNRKLEKINQISGC